MLQSVCTGEETNTAGVWGFGIVAALLLVAVIGLLAVLFTMRRHHSKVRARAMYAAARAR